MRAQLRINLQRLIFNVFDKLILSIGSPRCPSMHHLIKNEADCPNIAFRCVWLRL